MHARHACSRHPASLALQVYCVDAAGDPIDLRFFVNGYKAFRLQQFPEVSTTCPWPSPHGLPTPLKRP
jgi:hypothetical protein